MEVYAPIPESALPHAPRWLRTIGITLAVALLAYGGFRVVRFMYDSPGAMDFHTFGITQTRLGPAVVRCGGEGPECADGTALTFVKCTEAESAYFTGYYGTDADARIRALIGKRPPKGDHWVWACGWPSPPTKVAVLKPL